MLGANLTIAQRLGAEKSRLIDYPFPIYVKAADRKVFRSHLKKVVTSKQRQNCQIGLMTKSGTDLYVYLDSVFLRDSGGKHLCNTTVTDITERKQAEETNQLLISIVEASNDAIIGESINGIVTTWNNGAENLYGYAAEEIIGRPISILIPSDLTDESQSIFERIYRGEKIKHLWTLRQRKDGRSFAVSLTISPIINMAGQIIGASTIARDVSERVQTEKELRAAYAYARGLLEASLDPLLTINPHGKITDVNAATEAVTGCARDYLIGTDFSFYFTEPDKANDGYRSVFREGSLRDYPLEIRHRDGHATSVLYNASVYRDESGQIVGVFAAARDITAMKIVQHELIRSKNFIQRISDTLPDVLYLFDVKEQCYVYTNQQAETLLRYAQEQLGERGTLFLRSNLHPEDVPIMVKRDEQIRTLKDGDTLENEFRFKHGYNGDYHWFRSREVVFERTVDGLPSLILGIAGDFTRNKEAEEQLHAAELLFREFAENTDAVFWIATLDFSKILYVNPAYERIWQRSYKSLIENSWSWFESVHPEDRPTVSKVIKTNPEEGWAVDFRIIRPDGSVRWLRNRTFPLGGADQTIARMGGIVVDITEEKRMEQEAEYHHQQLSHADKLSALGEVIAGVAHEINNPTNFITYNIPLLGQTWKIIEPIVIKYAQAHPEWCGSELSLDELCRDMRDIIHDIRVGSDRIAKIVKNLKEFSRLNMTGDVGPVQVNDVIENTMTIVGAQIKKRAIKIAMELAPNLPEIEGHFNKLEQVVANLLVNASHAVSGRDDARIVITTRYIERLGAILIAVEDNGVGIQNDLMGSLFDPFFTTRRSEGGTGLGLSVSYGLIQDHKGIIGVLSKPGVGSRFAIFLPMDRDKELELIPSILYVGDDPVFLGMLQMHFIRVDHCAEGLRSSEDVTVCLAEHPEVDIVFHDLTRSNVNRWELLRMLKEQFPLLTTVFYCVDSMAVKARPEHVPEPDYLLGKDFTVDSFVAIVSKIGRQRL
ncbi:MAG: PAS domain S-box protein [Deltaproteobacteria bacterium]|nr:PAS domain S-box protein [Deltaproteobacteria bacterium]